MRREGLTAQPPRRFRATTDSRHGFAVAPNVVARDFSAPAPNRVWVTDMTYIWTWEGWLFLAAIVDLFLRRIVAMADHLRTELPLEALGMALGIRQPERGLVHHSDRGWQYASAVYRAELVARGIVCSISRVGDCWDNAVAESFFATLKRELIVAAPGRRRRRPGPPSTTTSGRSSIRTDVTRPSVTSARWTSRSSTLPRTWQHIGTVYAIGSSPP